MSISDHGYHFDADEEAALKELHLRGIRTFRSTGRPTGTTTTFHARAHWSVRTAHRMVAI